MEKFAYELENLFIEKLSVYKKMKTAFETEKTYLVDMDVDALWKMTDRKNQLAADIREIRERILSLFKVSQMGLDMSVEAFHSGDVIDRVPASLNIKPNLKNINVKLNTIKEELVELAALNKHYVNEHLTIINGIFSTITGSKNREQYTYSGVLSEDKAAKNIIRAEV